MSDRNRKQQKLARERMKKTGESYTSALAQVRTQSKVCTQAHPSQPPAIPVPSWTIVDGCIVTSAGLRPHVRLERPNFAETPPAASQVEHCRRWIERHCTPTKRIQNGKNARGSYYLKHQVEEWLRASGEPDYVSNGAFILAAHSLGYQVELDGEPNARFSMSVRLPHDAWKRVRPAAFSRWLFRNLQDDTPLGDLARDAKEDDRWPRQSREFNDFWVLVGRTAAAEAFLEGWKIWSSKQAPLSAARRFRMKIGKHIVDRHGLWYPGREEAPLSEDPAADEILKAKAWIKTYWKPGKEWVEDHTSYGLKHMIDPWIHYHGYVYQGKTSANGYVGNGAFIIAALQLGYKARSSHYPHPSLNAEFAFKWNDWPSRKYDDHHRKTGQTIRCVINLDDLSVTEASTGKSYRGPAVAPAFKKFYAWVANHQKAFGDRRDDIAEDLAGDLERPLSPTKGTLYTTLSSHIHWRGSSEVVESFHELYETYANEHGLRVPKPFLERSGI